MASRIAAFLGVLVWCAASLCAQGPASVAVGSRVRVQSSRHARVTGNVLSFSTDTIVLGTCGHCTPLTLPTRGITSLEVSMGRYVPGTHIIGGALIGLAAGASYAWYSAARSTHNCHDGPCGFAYVAVPILGLAGATIGGIAGGLWRSDRWERVLLNRD